MRASLHGDIKTTNLLLKSGADVNARSKDGRTALMYASEIAGPNEAVAGRGQAKSDISGTGRLPA